MCGVGKGFGKRGSWQCHILGSGMHSGMYCISIYCCVCCILVCIRTSEWYVSIQANVAAIAVALICWNIVAVWSQQSRKDVTSAVIKHFWG